MLTPNRHYPHLSYEVISNIAQIIDTQLIDGWAIRIEYTDEIKFLTTNWQQWGELHFMHAGSSRVIDNIFSCHVNNPLCAIRLHAEKFNPRSNLYYSVCQVCDFNKQTQGIP
ncbi:MAG: ribulose bisphosphate carboxylase small subunit [Gammaproteobacteria bacterium]